MKKIPEKVALDNHADQLNPEHPAFHRSRGLSLEMAQKAAEEAQRQHHETVASTAAPAKPPASSTSTRPRKAH